MVFRGKEVDFGRLGTSERPFGPRSLCGGGFCARWKFLEGLCGCARQSVGVGSRSPPLPSLWEAPFPGSAGPNPLPGISSPGQGARIAGEQPPVALGEGHGGAVGRLVGPDTLTLLPREPLGGTLGTPTPPRVKGMAGKG